MAWRNMKLHSTFCVRYEQLSNQTYDYFVSFYYNITDSKSQAETEKTYIKAMLDTIFRHILEQCNDTRYQNM